MSLFTCDKLRRNARVVLRKPNTLAAQANRAGVQCLGKRSVQVRAVHDCGHYAELPF